MRIATTLGKLISYGCLNAIALMPFTDPLAPPIPIQSSTSSNVPEAVTSHVATVVSSLRTELNKERTTNARVLEYAESEILRLQAQVARRDAELEACVIHAHDPTLFDAPEEVTPGSGDRLKPLPDDNGKSSEKLKRIDASQLSREEARRIMGLVEVRNEELEEDITRLSENVSSTQCLCVYHEL